MTYKKITLTFIDIKDTTTITNKNLLHKPYQFKSKNIINTITEQKVQIFIIQSRHCSRIKVKELIEEKKSKKYNKNLIL